MELSPLFSDDSRVAEAASIAQKLRKLTTFLSHGINTMFSLHSFHIPVTASVYRFCLFQTHALLISYIYGVACV